MIRIGHRFMTGQICSTTGNYEFDGYIDGTSQPLLVDDDKRIAVDAGKPFPQVASKGRDAYWRFTGWE
jgi:hypothetical protein